MVWLGGVLGRGSFCYSVIPQVKAKAKAKTKAAAAAWKQPQYGSMHSGATRQGIGQKGIGIHATPIKYIIQYFSKKTSGEAGEQKKPP